MQPIMYMKFSTNGSIFSDNILKPIPVAEGKVCIMFLLFLNCFSITWGKYSRDLCLPDIGLLQSLTALWKVVISTKFYVLKCVRQGELWSLLYYIHRWITHWIKAADIGCHIGNSVVGRYGYVYGQTIVSPTVQGLQHDWYYCYLS